MGRYGYVDVEKLCDCARNQTTGLTANHIMRFPRADVQPVRHGEWIPRDVKRDTDPRYMCSECGKELYTNYFEFCPQCGAKMSTKG